MAEESTSSSTAAIKPIDRNYFKEGQQRNIRNWNAVDPRSHPLSLVYTSVIEEAGKTSTQPTDTHDRPPSNPLSDPLSDPLGATTGDPLSDPLRDPLSFADPLFDPLRSTTAGDTDTNNSTATATVPQSQHSAQTHKSEVQRARTTSAATKNASNKSMGIMSEERIKRWLKEREGLPAEFDTWRDKRAHILTKYTSNKRIGVTANFLDEGDADEGGASGVGSENEQLKKKIEQLSMDTKEDKLFLSQTEYIKRMEHNVRRLRKAWQEGRRVLSLKIAIQSAKLLSENSVNTCPQFFPSMFVLVADILDSFGELVFERLSMKAVHGDVDNLDDNDQKSNDSASNSKKVLRDNFTAVDVSLEASETCQNWFFKIACIRELSPRLFIELSLFRCWRFIRHPSELSSVLERLSFMIRGIGDPLVAAYARAYLVHVGFMVLKERMRPVLLSTFDDFLFTFNELEKSSFAGIACLAQHKIARADYIDLYMPCLDWIVQCIGYKANEEEFFGLVQRYKEGWNNSIILLHILAKFENAFISKHSKGVTRLIKESVVTTVPRSALYRELGKSIIDIAPPEQIRLTLLNEIWKVVAKIDDATEYVDVASVYVEYLLQHFGKKEIDILLGDVIKHLKKDLAFQHLQDHVYAIVQHILRYMKDFKDLFQIMNFLTLIDMLQSGHKLSACKMILESFRRECNEGVSDPVLINSLLDVSRMLHDSVDYLTFDDEKRQVTDLICHLIDCIDYGHDLERQLNEYLECRAIFSNLDGIIYSLCNKVGNLAMKAHTLMHGKHNKKTSAFVKACLAYCHVTIPSLEDLWPRMYLFANLGQIALTNSMVVQAEAFFHAAISLVPSLPVTFSTQYTSSAVQSTPTLLADYVATFCSTLLLMPGHPSKGPFYLMEELIASLEQWAPWNKDAVTVEKCKAFLSMFTIFATFAQRKFPYSIKGVSSNDELYGRDAQYLEKCFTILNRFGRQIHKQLNELKASPKKLDQQAAGALGLQFMNILVDNVLMDKKSMKIISVVHEIVVDSKALDKKFYNNTMLHIQSRNAMLYEQLKCKKTKA